MTSRSSRHRYRPRRPRNMDLAEWFRSVLKMTPGPMPTQCHIWSRQVGGNGYGKLRVDRLDWLAHRLAWVLANGPIPDGLQVNHKCDVKLCCNPDHLYVGTQADNRRDAAKNDERGEDRYNAKLTDDLVREIRRAHDLGETYRAIAARLDTPFAATASAGAGRTWQHV